MNAAGKLIASFIMLIIGVSLIVVAATSTNAVTELSQRTDTIDIAGARLAGGVNVNSSYPFTLTNTGVNTYKFDYSECRPSTITFKNVTGTTLVEDTAYIYNPTNATLFLINGTGSYAATSNTTTAAFSYCGDGYVTLSWGRSALDTGIGLFGIALFLGAVGLALGSLRDLEVF